MSFGSASSNTVLLSSWKSICAYSSHLACAPKSAAFLVMRGGLTGLEVILGTEGSTPCVEGWLVAQNTRFADGIVGEIDSEGVC